MKNLIICLMLLVLSSCNGQKKEEIKIVNKKLTSQKTIKEIEIPINFLDKKYQQNGFSVPDDLNGDLYPSYNYSDKKIGIFSVNFVGKSDKIQYFWNVKNPSGYYSKFSSPEDKEAQNSKNIKNAFDEKDYYIIADLLPTKYITNLDEQSGDFDIKENAKTSIFLYDKDEWLKLGEFKTKNIPERSFQYYIKLIQNYKKDTIPKQFQGSFSTSVDTEETTTGMASISYYFNVSDSFTNLKMNTYHEPINCEGDYIGNMKNNILELYYAGDNMNCISIEPKFRIKMENNKYFIKGVGGEGTINDWNKLNKKNNQIPN